MFINIRLHSQQLANPDFNDPKELVSWMGAIQAQDYAMVKWAVGVRLKSATIGQVEEALRDGRILRTHVMRPTWHLIAAEDIRWMLKLSAQRIKAANDSYARGRMPEITETMYSRAYSLMEKTLSGGKHLTKQELEDELKLLGLDLHNYEIARFLMRAEADGVVCSGADKAGKPTYALLEERVPPVKELHKEEALAKLALNYFRSHSPATLQDFVWWSGLTVTEARQAVGLLDTDLLQETFAGCPYLIHSSCRSHEPGDDIVHYLPPYDEYLVSYKERTQVLKREHHARAFNTWGIFYPVVLHKGDIVGNWKKSARKTEVLFETSFFSTRLKVSAKLIRKAEEEYKTFFGLSR